MTDSDSTPRFAHRRLDAYAVALEMAEVVGLGSPARLRRLRQLADRVAAMLTGLIRCERARPPVPARRGIPGNADSAGLLR